MFVFLLYQSGWWYDDIKNDNDNDDYNLSKIWCKINKYFWICAFKIVRRGKLC